MPHNLHMFSTLSCLLPVWIQYTAHLVDVIPALVVLLAAVVAAREAARREAYLQLDLPEGSVLWVDDAAGCVQAQQVLAGSDVLGLDVEWKPSHVAGVTSPAAVLQVRWAGGARATYLLSTQSCHSFHHSKGILCTVSGCETTIQTVSAEEMNLHSCCYVGVQIASRTHVALFDLITLCQQQPEALESCLAPLLCSSSVLKLGFEVSGDISKLAGSWPAMSCFRQVVSVLDLRPVWVAYGLATKQQVR